MQFNSSLQFKRLASDTRTMRANMLLQAQHLMSEKRLSEAALVLEKLALMSPKDYKLYMNLGAIYMMQENWHQALEATQKALKLSSDNSDVLCNLGTIMVNLAKEKEHNYDLNGSQKLKESARRYFLLAIGRNREHTKSMNNLAALLIEKAQYSEALSIIERSLAVNPDQATPWYQRGILELFQCLPHEKDKINGALEYINKALDTNEKVAKQVVDQALQWEIRDDVLSKFRDAHTKIQQDIAQKSPLPLTTGLTIQEEVSSSPATNSDPEKKNHLSAYTIPLLKCVCDRQPGNLHALMAMAGVCWNNGLVEESEKYWKSIVQLEPEHYEAHFQLGKISYFMNISDAAQMYFEKCVEIDPSRSDPITYLAMIEDLKGRSKKSHQLHQKALKSEHVSHFSCFECGLSFMKQGNFEAAFKLFVTASQEENKIETEQTLAAILKLLQAANNEDLLMKAIEKLISLDSHFIPVVQVLHQQLKETVGGTDEDGFQDFELAQKAK